MLSVEYSGRAVKAGHRHWTVGLRRSDEIRSCRYFSGVDHSHEVITIFAFDARKIPARSDFVRPAQSDGQLPMAPLYGSPEYSTDKHADPGSENEIRCRFSGLPVADPEMPEIIGSPDMPASVKPLEPSAYWGEEKTLGHARRTTTTPCSTTRAGSGSPPPCGGMDKPGVLQTRFPTIRRPRCSHWKSSARQVAMLDPRTMKYSFIDTCFATHHPAVRLRRQ